MKIAFLGVGTMGRPMLANLVKKGHSVVAYDIAPEALSAAVKLGAGAAGSAAEATAQGEIVIAMLQFAYRLTGNDTNRP
jgi:3-hydroxyisobutyrate dehydrogenase